MKFFARGLVFLGAVWLAAGCGSPPAPQTEMPPATQTEIRPAAPTDVPALPVPTATLGPPFFTPIDENPVFPHGEEGDWYAGAVEPGAVIRADGRWYMFFNGFTGWPAKAAVGLASSGDGRAWSLEVDSPLLDSSAAEFEGFTFFVSAVLQLENGEWAMYLYTLDEGRDGAPGGILAASADQLEGPWTLRPGFALAPGAAGGWDASRVTQPHVIRTADGYRMYFAGYENDRLQGGRQIGVAFSRDGYTWEKQPEPVFTVSGELGDWDSHRVFQPRVLTLEDGFLMMYKSNISVGRAEGWGFATSPDGLVWTRLDANPFIDENTYGIEWRRNGIGELVVADDGQLHLFLEILEREGGGYHHGNAAYGSNIFLFISETLP